MGTKDTKNNVEAIVKANDILCKVTCTGGLQFDVLSCVQGRLYEVNDKLLDNPHILADSPSNKGYVAIICPKRTRKHGEETDAFQAPNLLEKLI